MSTFTRNKIYNATGYGLTIVVTGVPTQYIRIAAGRVSFLRISGMVNLILADGWPVAVNPCFPSLTPDRTYQAELIPLVGLQLSPLPNLSGEEPLSQPGPSDPVIFKYVTDEDVSKTFQSILQTLDTVTRPQRIDGVAETA